MARSEAGARRNQRFSSIRGQRSSRQYKSCNRSKGENPTAPPYRPMVPTIRHNSTPICFRKADARAAGCEIACFRIPLSIDRQIPFQSFKGERPHGR